MSIELKTYTFDIPNQQQPFAKYLSSCTAKIYSKAVKLNWLMYKIKDKSPTKKALSKYLDQYFIKRNNFAMHSQSKQAAYQQYFEAKNAYFKTREKYIESGNTQALEKLNPPYKTKYFNKVVYKKSAFSLKEDQNGKYLRISNGRSGNPFKIYGYKLDIVPKKGEIIFNYKKRKYELRLTVEVEVNQKVNNFNNQLAIDLGQIHPMSCFENKNNKSFIFNGGELNAKLQYRNKKLAEFQRKISKCKRNSKNYRKLKRAKDRILGNLKNQINDVLEKYVSYLIGYCLKEDIGTIIVGDIKGIRKNIDFHKVVNQKLHQWQFNRILKILERKSKYVGIKVVKQNEAYTTKSCPKCGYSRKPKGRDFKCPKCKFIAHRDAVGAINIYRKWNNEDLKKPTKIIDLHIIEDTIGVRYDTNMKMPIEWNPNPFKETKSIQRVV